VDDKERRLYVVFMSNVLAGGKTQANAPYLNALWNTNARDLQVFFSTTPPLADSSMMPSTPGRLKAKLLSLESASKWLLDILCSTDSELFRPRSTTTVPKESMFQSFLMFCGRSGLPHRPQNKFWSSIYSIIPAMKPRPGESPARRRVGGTQVHTCG
jgi:hypothetical protein